MKIAKTHQSTGTRRLAALSAGLVLLSGCQAAPPPPNPMPPVPAELAGSGRQSGAISPAPGGEAGSTVDYGQRPPPRIPGAGSVGAGDVTLNFPDMDIREMVAAVLGKVLGVPYTIDPSVSGTVNLVTPAPVPRDKVLPMLLSVFAQRGVTIVESAGLYQVVPLAATTNRPLLSGLEAGGGGGAELVPLHYMAAPDLAKLLQPFVSHGAKITADPAHNTLLVAGDQLARSTLVDMIRAFDTDLLAGQSYALFPVTSGTPEKVASELEKALLGGKDGPLASELRIIPMPRINAVLVASLEPHYIDAARRLLHLVDKASASSEPSWHIYYVRNGQSADLEYILQQAFTPNKITSTGSSDTNRLASAVPGSKSASQSSPASGSDPNATPTGPLPTPGAGSTGPVNEGSLQAGGGAGTGAPPALQSLSSTGSEDQDDSTSRIRIIANRRNNALLIYAPPDRYKIIEAMLEKIDIVPLQVHIEAQILEVTLNDQLQYGTQFFFHNGFVSGELNGTSAAAAQTLTPAALGVGDLGSTAPNFLLNLGTRRFDFVLNALRAVTDVRVLSAPQVSVLDNELATIQVGDEVPLTTQSQQSTQTTGAPIVNSISYRQTGVILQIIPRVNSSGLVTLDLSQIISDPQSTITSNIDSPTFQNRSVQSRIVVQDGQTFGVAGLIRDTKSVGNSGVPYLKDVPLIGTIFSEQNNSRTRTELLVLLTPHVIYDQRDARAITDDLRNGLARAAMVPGDLSSMSLGSSANPGRAFEP